MPRLSRDRRLLIVFFVLFVALPFRRMATADFEGARAVDLLLVFAAGMSLGAFIALAAGIRRRQE